MADPRIGDPLVYVGPPHPPRCKDGAHVVGFGEGERCECGAYTMNELIRLMNLNREKQQ